MTNMNEYFAGDKLYGDDFKLEQLREWYEDEVEGYANLGAKNRASYRYVYHALNYYHGFKYIQKKIINSALGIGSAYGDEFKPILKNIKQITILDHQSFVQDECYGIPCKYIKPSVDGKMPFEGNSFDLITCLGVLHHIPNVSFVMSEVHRCLAKNGLVLIREPIVSMGDWTKPRKGGTKRERGIPIGIFNQINQQVGFKVLHSGFCVFRPLSGVCRLLGVNAYNNKLLTCLDAFLCKITNRNTVYHPEGFCQKFQPSSIFYVLIK
ncbi:MAG: class I SAM-dependent methyltransferase [Phycisphaerae bacterium]